MEQSAAAFGEQSMIDLRERAIDCILERLLGRTASGLHALKLTHRKVPRMPRWPPTTKA